MTDVDRFDEADDVDDGERRPPFRDGRVHVCAELCSTCVFRPGNRMQLRPGRLRGMIRDSRRHESAIVCHQTLHGEHPEGEAVCRGFFDRFATQPLQVADRLGMIEWQQPTKGDGHG